MKKPDRLLDRLAQLARSAKPPEGGAPSASADQILRQLRNSNPESPLVAWQFFAMRALPWAAVTVVLAAGLHVMITSTPLPTRDPVSELIAQYTQP